MKGEEQTEKCKGNRRKTRERKKAEEKREVMNGKKRETERMK